MKTYPVTGFQTNKQPNKQTVRKNQTVVTPQDLVEILKAFVGKTFLEVSLLTGVSFSENLGSKGCVGHFIEDLVGLPRCNDRLDFDWGDLKTKTYHKGQQIGGCVVGSLNSLVSELLDSNVCFDDFVLGKKIGQTVLVGVCTNRRGGGDFGQGWRNFTFESASAHALNQTPEWKGIVEDFEFLKNYISQCFLTGEKVSSGKKGPNDFLTFNSCGGSLNYRGFNLRNSGGIQLALGATLVRRVCQVSA